MIDDYYIARKREMERFFKIKQYFCHEKRCIFFCSEFQKKSCLDYYWMLAIGDKSLKEIKHGETKNGR